MDEGVARLDEVDLRWLQRWLVQRGNTQVKEEKERLSDGERARRVRLQLRH